MDPKLLEDEGLVLDDCLLELADGGLPFPCLNNWLLELELEPEPGLDLPLQSLLVMMACLFCK